MADPRVETNRRLWDELVAVHAASDFYDLPSFRAGGTSLRPVELEEVGDVQGKRLLHLQCHFGMDSISWAHRGASVVGVDFSAEAIKLARRLAAELGVDAEFVQADVCELPDQLGGVFDVVVTSYGTIVWLPDLACWASTIRRFLAPTGFFYIVDQHPFAATLNVDGGRLVIEEPYFASDPVEEESDGSYADRTAALQNRKSFQWQHPLSEIVSAVTGAGLRIEFLHEFPFSSFAWLPGMIKDQDGWWRLPEHPDVPLLFSLRARP